MKEGSSRFADAGTVLLLVFLIGTAVILSRFTAPEDTEVLSRFMSTFWRSGLTVCCWLMGATGFGVWILRWLPEELSVGIGRGSRLLAAMGLGTAVLLWLDSLLGTTGLLSSQTVAWGVLAVGILLLAWAIRTSSSRLAIGPGEGWLPPLSWAAAPALAVLFVAACSAPGWLWQTEFGGYDALSYHLQLPREWFIQGQILTPTWNVYGGFPSFVEGAYLHLMVIDGGPLATAITAQLLHASFALLTAATTAAAIGRWFDRSYMGFGFALCLGVPWLIVVGSLAYNEMAASLMGATAMLLLVPRTQEPRVSNSGGLAAVGITAGLLAATACGAKLTAFGFIALPIGYLMLRRLQPRGWRIAVPLGLLAGAVVLAPWWIRNMLATGNPVFPFASGLFGNGHFSGEQMTRFQNAHASGLGFFGRLGELWHQVFAFGFGANPTPGEPWRPQWSLLPLIATAGIVVGILRERSRRTGIDLLVMLGCGVVFWLFFTHLKSRFLVPAIPLMVAAATLLLPARLPSLRAGRPLLGIALLIWCMLPLWLFRSERLLRNDRNDPGVPASAMMVGRMDVATGLLFTEQARAMADPEQQQKIISQGGFKALGPVLPPDERILALGNASPFLSSRRYEYATVWDNHPLAELLAEHPDDPDAVVRALRERGTTLLLINYPMLQRWRQSGWLDPRLDPEQLAAVTERLLLQARWLDGEALYQVPQTEVSRPQPGDAGVSEEINPPLAPESEQLKSTPNATPSPESLD
ncbi:MAG: hypothetical protein CBC35_10865 [Planctomycetes bacterium TMED75]|nr:hypothetical protein [Planctomycetaceae bacterium]OUU90753.1 MAG: hypothetical protein CBC35_10865 [Planctomycetes bacterium TMED75]